MNATRLARSASSRYAVRDEHGQAVAHQLIQNRPEIAARNRIHAVGRLIQKQHARLVQQRAHQRQLLFHPAREFRRPGACRNGSMRVIRSSRAVSSSRSLPGDAEQIGVERHVLVDRRDRCTGRSAAPCSRSDPSPRPALATRRGRRQSPCPSVGFIRPHSSRMVVVLPAPSGPTSPKISPSAISRFSDPPP